MSDKWTLLITGTDHGLVGAFGNQFVAHPDRYERVDVVRADHHAELVEALRSTQKLLDNMQEHACACNFYISESHICDVCINANANRALLAKLETNQ
jgi:hypothetical protein